MKKIFLTTLLAVCSLSIHAQFSGQGSGTEKDPYQITNADQLFDVRNDLTAYYKVMNDIDLGAWIQEDNPNQGWNPIGNVTTAFSGCFDGNSKSIIGLKINRVDADYIGFFGVIRNGTIKNVSLVNPIVCGRNNVGAVVGMIDVRYGGNVTDIILVGGKVTGDDYVGGVVGRVGIYHYEYCSTSSSIVGCSVTSVVNGKSGVGGIVGSSAGWVYRSNETYNCYIKDNCFYGKVESSVGYAGAICGQEEPIRWDSSYRNFQCFRNIGGGVVIAQSTACGVLGSFTYNVNDGTINLSNNVCVADTIFSVSDVAYTIANESFENNYGIYTTAYFSKGKKSESGVDNVPCYGKRTLQRGTTYIGLGFDFSKQWAIIEEETFPYNISQSEPAHITSFVSGSKSTISGTASGNGVVYVIVDGGVKQAPILDGKWEVDLGNVRKDSEAKVSVRCGEKTPSLIVKAIAENAPVAPAIFGDANADGVIDSADVTAIINYILGTPSTSFNKENADVTGDGEILIDDAVQAVQMIMDAQ